MATAAAPIAKVKEVTYLWEGKDKSGKVIKGQMRAGGTALVNVTLRRQGIVVTKVAMFTSATQVYHLFQVADDERRREALCAGFARVLVASIGPVCSEALREHGVSPDMEPVHAKMGQLVREVAQRGPHLLQRKRGGGATA